MGKGEILKKLESKGEILKCQNENEKRKYRRELLPSAVTIYFQLYYFSFLERN